MQKMACLIVLNGIKSLIYFEQFKAIVVQVYLYLYCRLKVNVNGGLNNITKNGHGTLTNFILSVTLSRVLGKRQSVF